MSTVSIRDELMNMKLKLESLEEELTKQLVEAEVKYKKWNEIDKEVDEMRTNHYDIITLNVGGKIFQTKYNTLLSVKDTFFFKIIVSKKLDLQDPVFIDRNYKYFKYILTYLRYQKVNLSKLDTHDINELLEEANFYEIEDLVSYIEESGKDVKFINFETNGTYSAGVMAGTNNLDDINNFDDRSLMKGICATTPGWIIFEMTREIEFDQIEIGGWNGNSGIWAPSNGSGAKIQTSIDKANWTEVGLIPSEFNSSIITTSVTKSRAKWVKVLHTSYLGLGYCRILGLKH